MTNYAPSRDEILKAYAVEFEEDTKALSKFIAQFPQYSIELVDLSRELTRQKILEDQSQQVDEDFINVSIERYKSGRVKTQSLQNAPIQIFKDAAKRLGIPFQIMISIRERRVEPSTIATQILDRFAETLKTTRNELQAFLALPLQVSAGRVNKSDQRPETATKVDFERVLSDAGMTRQRFMELLEQGE